MNFKFKACKKEFDGGNFTKALHILNEIGSDDEDYNFALMLKYNCLMGIGCYADALNVINFLIAENPCAYLLWVDKVKCHYFLDDLINANGALDNAERLVDLNNVGEIIGFVKLCNLLGDYVKALKYCNSVLDIDKNHIGALIEKALVSNILNDKKMMNECGDKLLEVADNNLSLLMTPFALKLFSGMYQDCFNIILDITCIDSNIGAILKKVIYNQMLYDLNIQIWTENSVELTIDESIMLLFDYRYGGIEFGEIKNVKYIILEQN